MPKTITEQIEDLQNENAHLKELEKLFEKACKIEFGTSAKSIKKMLKNPAENCSDFELKICSYFQLNSEEDKAAFLSIMCSDSSFRYFSERRKHYQPEIKQG